MVFLRCSLAEDNYSSNRSKHLLIGKFRHVYKSIITLKYDPIDMNINTIIPWITAFNPLSLICLRSTINPIAIIAAKMK